jgi:O-methyltransferase involved in polyketide biosynthesis
MYLSREAISSTLQSVRRIAASGSELVFDYLDADAFKPDRVSARVRDLMEYVRSMGEPMLSGFESAALPSELLALGFHVLENLSPAVIQDLYFQDRSDDFRAAEHFHFLRACVQ